MPSERFGKLSRRGIIIYFRLVLGMLWNVCKKFLLPRESYVLCLPSSNYRSSHAHFFYPGLLNSGTRHNWRKSRRRNVWVSQNWTDHQYRILGIFSLPCTINQVSNWSRSFPIWTLRPRQKYRLLYTLLTLWTLKNTFHFIVFASIIYQYLIELWYILWIFGNEVWLAIQGMSLKSTWSDVDIW
jgi:hypothetical protein